MSSTLSDRLDFRFACIVSVRHILSYVCGNRLKLIIGFLEYVAGCTALLKLSSCSVRESFAKKLHTPALLDASAPASILHPPPSLRIDHRDLGRIDDYLDLEIVL